MYDIVKTSAVFIRRIMNRDFEYIMEHLIVPCLGSACNDIFFHAKTNSYASR